MQATPPLLLEVEDVFGLTVHWQVRILNVPPLFWQAVLCDAVQLGIPTPELEPEPLPELVVLPLPELVVLPEPELVPPGTHWQDC